jgi:D-aspartate ligase
VRVTAFVLTMGAYYGTLSAVRCLGDRSVPVILADSRRLAPALWSRHVTRREHCPPARPVDRFVDWLLALGRRDPGHVLYATSDDLAWAFAERQDDLKRHFQLLTPAFADVVSILDKQALYAACSSVGLTTPRTWFPTAEADFEAVAGAASFPVIIKPRTQVLLSTLRKGNIVASSGGLRAAYAAFVDQHRYHPRSIARGALAQPMIQEFHGGEAIYSVSGFSDYRHGLFVARAAIKLAQWPRSAGIGIHFADAPLDEGLARRVQRLCDAARFVGVFEAEFVTVHGEPTLIDFNPRFFGQMGFDVARGLPSPFLAYLAATQQISRLRAEVTAARDWRPSGPMLYANRTALAWTRAAQRLVGRELTSWRLGPASRGPFVRTVDAATDVNDWVPGILDSVQQIARVLGHPRSVIRSAMSGD